MILFFLKLLLVGAYHLALCNNVLKTLYVADKLWWLSHWKYCSMWVGFLYTMVVRILLGPWETRVSKKGKTPLSLGFSMVSWMWGSMEVMCWRNCWLWSACWMTKVSSTYPSQSLGRFGAVLMALDLNSSMNWLAMRGLIGESIAAPWTLD